jgi:hypothetical protein
LPAQLLGDWFLPPSADSAIFYTPCPSPATAANCFVQLTLTATTFRLTETDAGGRGQFQGYGNVVVNHNEIDFFNGACDGLGRYTWTLRSGLLDFTLISDPCPRPDVLTYHGYSPNPPVPGWSRTP